MFIIILFLLVYLHLQTCFHTWTYRIAKMFNSVWTFSILFFMMSQWLRHTLNIWPLDHCKHTKHGYVDDSNDLPFSKQKSWNVHLDMNLVGTWSSLLRSLKGFTGFDHATNQVHIPVNLSTCYLFLNMNLSFI